MTVEADSNSPIIELGTEIKGKLLHTNPILRPDELIDINSQYRDFYPHRHGYRFWSSTERLNEVMQHYFQHSKVLLLISGVAAGGKDALREKIEELTPGNLYKIVTATSRDPRSGENHGVDYYFYKGAQDFLDAVDQGEFLEKNEQAPGRWYGLPKQSLIDALSRPEPVICSHVEMSAWPKVEEFIEETYKDNPQQKPFVLKVFVMPEMTAQEYFTKWLPAHRTEHESRAIRAGWELHHAPSVAHFLVTNVVDQTGTSLELEAKTLLNTMSCLFMPEIQLSSYEFSPISPGISTTEDILNFQDRKAR